MKEINIVPIFKLEQPQIWNDFWQVRVAAMRTNYNVELTAFQYSCAIEEFNKFFHERPFNFAFAAYDGDKIVGCINGDALNGDAHIRHLYVLPEYQGKRIGIRLLTAAEKASSLVAIRMHLTSLKDAKTFYAKYGYTRGETDNQFIRSLSNVGHLSTTPVFDCTPKINRACKKLSADFDYEMVKCTGAPMFVSRDCLGRINGYSVVFGTDKPIIVAPDRFVGLGLKTATKNYLNNTR